MSGNDAGEDLVAMIDRLEQETEGDEVSIGAMVEAIGQRAFGSLFVLTSLLAILPTGAIPGMSILTGTVMLILSVQLLLGQDKVWLPGVLEKRTIPRDKLVSSLDAARGWAGTIGKVSGPRLTALVRPPVLQLVAVVAIVLSLSMYPLALVPFGAFPAGLALLVFGVGLMTRDGLLIAFGIAIGALGLMFAYLFWPF